MSLLSMNSCLYLPLSSPSLLATSGQVMGSTSCLFLSVFSVLTLCWFQCYAFLSIWKLKDSLFGSLQKTSDLICIVIFHMQGNTVCMHSWGTYYGYAYSWVIYYGLASYLFLSSIMHTKMKHIYTWLSKGRLHLMRLPMNVSCYV